MTGRPRLNLSGSPAFERNDAAIDFNWGWGAPANGFPSDDFRQEPKGNRAIAEQCFDVYGVRFPMFAKSGVVGQTANPFFAALARETGEVPQWNFHKYLIDRQGRAVASFPGAVDSLDRRLTGRIEQLLATR